MVSSLISRRDNPDGNIYLCLGMAVAFLILYPLPGYFCSRLTKAAPKTAAFSYWAMRIGVFAAIAVGVERFFLVDLSTYLHKAHEAIALAAFMGMFLGIVGFWLAFTRTWQTYQSTLTTCGVFLLTAGPMLGVASSQAYLYFTPNTLGWVGPHWAQWGVPVYYSFAFWEWLASAGIVVYLGLLLALLPAREPTSSN